MESKANNKIIHYIWFGGNPISELTKKCIQTWKKFLPDFEIKEWNETNFDVNQCPFVKEAYAQKKWAFVADYTRFKVLEEYGGIYLDTDMEITADISKYLELDLFMGQEDSKMINAAVVWAKEAHNPRIKDIVDYYESCEKFNPTGDLYDQSVPRVLTKYFEQIGFDKELDKIQSFDDGKTKIYPMEYFYPLSYDYQNNKFTDNSCMIHHFDATWISPMEKFKTKMKRKNMVWVVYVIDFFVALKNKIKFFSNPKDIATLVTMFGVLFASLLALNPIPNNSSILSLEFGKATLQITLMSLIWTFICAKIRNIDFNFVSDRVLGRKEEDVEKGIIENKVPNLEQYKKIKKSENILFVFEYLLTILISLFPIFKIAVIVPNNSTLYCFVLLAMVYMLHLGMSKKFGYRILELIPIGIILGLLIMTNFSLGLLMSVVTFGYVMINLFVNKQQKKRIITLGATYLVCLIIALIYSFNANTINIQPSVDLASTSTIEKAVEYVNVENIDTQFNYIKAHVVNGVKNFANIPLFASQLTYFVTSIVLSIVLALITKNRKYLFFIAVIVLNTIQLIATGVNFGYMNVILMAVIALIVAEKIALNLIKKSL